MENTLSQNNMHMGSHQIVESKAYKQCMENENDTAKNFEFLIF